MNGLTDLIAALEAATGPSRELDARIYTEVVNSAYEILVASEGKVRYAAGGHPFGCPRYTASLDAALSVMPDGWQWDAGTFAPDEVFCPGGAQAAVHDHRHSDRYAHAEAATPALALITAIMRARMQNDEN